MRRLTRIFVNLLTVTSLLLSLAVGWLWVRGYTSYDDLGVVTTSKTADYRADRHFALGSDVGGLTWKVTTYEWTTPKAVASAWMPEGTSFWRNVLEAEPRPTFIVASDRLGGFNIRHDRSAAFDPEKIYSWRKTEVRTPMWFVLFVVAGPAIVRSVLLLASRVKQGRRRRAGFCPTCGYDLRASREQCPECGAPTAVRPAA
jgi:hypothetical protein